MRFAVPVANGKLTQHFGHSRRFALVDVDPEAKTIVGSTIVEAPDHQPGLLPPWLEERGVNVVISGGMGSRAKSLFEALSITVCTGAPEESPESLIVDFLNGRLVSREVTCHH